MHPALEKVSIRFWIFHVRPNEKKQYFRVVSKEFGEKHPDFTGLFFSFAVLVLFGLLMFWITSILKTEDRIFHQKMFNSSCISKTFFYGASGRIRTYDPLFRRQVL
jgi:hypothetical protein